MFQARQMLTENMDGVALSDDSVVGAYTRKWAPVLEGMEHPPEKPGRDFR